MKSGIGDVHVVCRETCASITAACKLVLAQPGVSLATQLVSLLKSVVSYLLDIVAFLVNLVRSRKCYLASRSGLRGFGPSNPEGVAERRE